MKHRHLRLVGGVVVALLIALTPIYADDTTEDFRSELAEALNGLFELGNECKPINLAVEEVGSRGIAMGLTKEAITTTVRSRLRAARLYRSGSGPYLYVNVNILPGATAFSVTFEFRKLLSDPKLSGLEGFATTWDRAMVGQTMNVGYIFSWISQLTDEFIDDYLRVNESACSRSPIDP